MKQVLAVVVVMVVVIVHLCDYYYYSSYYHHHYPYSLSFPTLARHSHSLLASVPQVLDHCTPPHRKYRRHSHTFRYFTPYLLPQSCAIDESG